MFKNNTSDLNIKYLKLEITNGLMEIEYRKMDYLKCQLKALKLPDLLKIRVSNEIFFIERKIQKLQQEYQLIGLEFIEVNRINYLNKQNCKNQLQFINTNLKKNNRSQPAIGIKQTSKARPTIFPIIESYLRSRSPTSSSDNSDTDNRSSGNSSEEVSLGSNSPECIDRLEEDTKGNDNINLSPCPSSPTSSSSSSLDDTNLLSSSVDSGTSSIDSRNSSSPETVHLYENVHISPPPPPKESAKEFTFKDTTMASLLQHLLPTAHHTPDHSYTFTFLLCSRLFLRPDQLFQQIFFTHFLDGVASTGTETGGNLGGGIGGGAATRVGVTATPNSAVPQKKFYKNFIENLLYEWITVFPYDFTDDRAMALLVDFAQKAHATTLEKNFAKNLLKYMDRKLKLAQLYDNYLKSLLPEESQTQSHPQSQCILVVGGHKTAAGENVGGDAANHRVKRPIKTLEDFLFHRHRSASSSSPSSTSPTDLDSKGEKMTFLLDIFSKERSQESAKRTLADLRRLANDSDIMDLCHDAKILAQQLTLIEFERLSFIGPQEFVQTFIKEQLKHQKTIFAEATNNNNDNTNTPKTGQEKPPPPKVVLRNVDNYVTWFNRLSNLVASEIVNQAKPKSRVKMCEFWIEVASECFEMRNLNSLMAIIAGLNMAPISRLKKMWSKVTTLSKFQWLEQQMDPSNNFSNYRAILKASLRNCPSSAPTTTTPTSTTTSTTPDSGRGSGDRKSTGGSDAGNPFQFPSSEKNHHHHHPQAKEESNASRQLMIPFFSLLVKDLYFLNEGCASRLPNGHINFEKCWQFSKQITEFLVWKEYQCTFEKVHAVIFYLETKRTCQDDNELALKSFNCEPPENLVEKGRLRLLKKSP